MQPAKVLKGFQDCELVVEGNFLGHVAKMMTRSWLLAQYLKSHDLHINENLALTSLNIARIANAVQVTI